MNSYSFTHLSDHAVLSLLAIKLRVERRATAEVLALIAEAEARALHLAAGYSSMFRYCVDVFHLSDQAAYRRINVSRAARRFPEIFPALAEGRLHMTAVELLIPHLTEETAHDLLAAAVHRPSPKSS